MEPTLPTPNNVGNQAAGPNLQPARDITPVESLPSSSPERSYEAESLAATSAAATTQQPEPTVVPGPTPPPTVVASSTTDDPLIADDVDVIEKEWVDKAKKIVSATRNDPHQQEKDVSKLQANYLLKRYNKQVKLAE